jgi:hypothetical protein
LPDLRGLGLSDKFQVIFPVNFDVVVLLHIPGTGDIREILVPSRTNLRVYDPKSSFMNFNDLDVQQGVNAQVIADFSEVASRDRRNSC